MFILFQDKKPYSFKNYIYGPLCIKLGKNESAIVAFNTYDLTKYANELLKLDMHRIIDLNEVQKNITIVDTLKQYRYILLFSEQTFNDYMKTTDKGNFDLPRLKIENKFF